MTYRNIKSFLPFVIKTKYDRELHLLDHALLFGHDPATLLHNVLGTGVAAYVLSFVYLWFLPMVPLVVTAWVVWVAQPVLRLLVRDLAVPGLGARHHLLLRAADARPRASATSQLYTDLPRHARPSS